MFQKVLEIIGLLLLSATKFVGGPLASSLAGYGFWETVLITSCGGMAGVLFFYYSGLDMVMFILGVFIKVSDSKKVKKIFTRKNKFLVRMGKGSPIVFALLTPIILSIPIGAIVSARYYGQRRSLLWLILAVLFWSFVISGFVFWS